MHVQARPNRAVRFVPRAQASQSFPDAFRSTFRRAHTPQEIPGTGVRRGSSVDTWTITPRSAVRYLEQTRHVHTALRVGLECPIHAYEAFRPYEIDRSEELTHDLTRLRFRFERSESTDADPYVPGVAYAAFLNECAFRDPVTFLCHLYAVAFAHVSGGPMIARRMETTLDLPYRLEAFGSPSYDPEALRGTFFRWAETLDADARTRALFEAERAFERVWSVTRLVHDDEPDTPEEEWRPFD